MPARPQDAKAYRLRTVRRLIALIRQVDACERLLPPLSELAKRHDCSTRTIRRDLQALREAGIPAATRVEAA